MITCSTGINGPGSSQSEIDVCFQRYCSLLYSSDAAPSDGLVGEFVPKSLYTGAMVLDRAYDGNDGSKFGVVRDVPG